MFFIDSRVLTIVYLPYYISLNIHRYTCALYCILYVYIYVFFLYVYIYVCIYMYIYVYIYP